MEDIQYNSTLIIGAGGLGREIYSWINHSDEDFKKYKIAGFLNDVPEALTGYNIQAKILGNIDIAKFKNDSKFIIAIANCKFKENIFLELLKNNASLASYKHITTIISSRTDLGDGIVLSPNVIISCDVKIGNLVFVNCGSQIGHDVTIDDYSSIMPSVNIGGGAKIGKRVFIGTGAVILPGVKIPDDTIIGAGSVVIRSIKQAGTYFGNPAKKIF